MSTVLPSDSVTLSLSDEDVRILLAAALNEYVLRNGYPQYTSFFVSDIEWNEERGGWDIEGAYMEGEE